MKILLNFGLKHRKELLKIEKEEKIVGSVERDETESGEKRGKRTKRT